MKPSELFLPLIFINIMAMLVGFWYYSDQMAFTPPSFLLFVPDCPLYILFFIIVALGMLRNQAFAFLASAGMVKYGLWTVFIILFHSGFYFLPFLLPFAILFIAGHIGMAAEGAAIMPKKRGSIFLLLAVIAWFLLNDFVDYGIGTAPSIPRHSIDTVAMITAASSIAIPALLYFFGSALLALPPIAFLRSIIFFKEEAGRKAG